MRRRPRRTSAPCLMESLEPRQYLTASPTPLPSVTLPGADSAWSYSSGPFTASPVTADLDGDGKQEVLVPGGDDNLYAYKMNASNTAMVIDHEYSAGSDSGQIESTPIVVNLASGPAVFYGNSQGWVFGFNARTGALLPGWPQNVTTGSENNPDGNGVYGALASGDLDGDGVPEIVVTSMNHEVIAYHANGTVMWRFNNDDTIFSGAAIGDLNDDGHLEVVVGGDSSASQFYWQGGRIDVLSSDGRLEWMYQTNQTIWSSPVLADLLNNGQLDVVVGTGYFYSSTSNPPSSVPFPGNEVYAINPQGNLLPGWPYQTAANTVNAQTESSPAIADLTGNGQLDVIIEDGSGKIHAITPNGTALAGWPIQAFATQNLWTSPIVADVNGEDQPEVIAAAAGVISAFSANGANVYRDNDNLPHYSAGAVAQLAGNGSWQMVFIGEALGSGNALLSPSTLEVWNLPSTTLAPPWPMLRQTASADVVVRSANLSTNLINQLYTNVLGRSPASSDLAYWLAAFDSAPNLELPILSIIGSTEARTREITSWYQMYLNRAPDPGGLNYWLSSLAAGATYADSEIGFLDSSEFFNNSGGTNTSWVTALYQILLHRTPSSSETTYWVNRLNAGTASRASVAAYFLLSPENTANEVAAWYSVYQPGGVSTPGTDQLEAAGWDLRRGAREEVTLASILASYGDYCATQVDASYIRAMYSDLLQRAPATTDVAYWLDQMEAGLTLAQFATALVTSGEYRGDEVQAWYQKLLGRAASSGELTTWINAFNSGQTIVNMISAIVTGSEFIADAGNVTQYINNVFNGLLDHAPSASQLSYWQNEAMTQNIYQLLPSTILSSSPTEFYEVTISDWYYKFLRRLPSTPADHSVLIASGTPFGAQNLVNLWAGGASPDSIQIAILTSTEYVSLTTVKAFWTGARWLTVPAV